MKCSKWDHIDFNSYAEFTVILEGGFALTGRILNKRDIQEKSDIQEERDIQEESEFFWLKLTCPFCASGIAYFPENAIVTININQILLIGPKSQCPSNNM